MLADDDDDDDDKATKCITQKTTQLMHPNYTGGECPAGALS